METAFYCVIVFIVTATGTILYSRGKTKQSLAEADGQLLKIRDLEKQLHLKDAEALRAKNDSELLHFEALRLAREEAREEGVALGKSECEKDYLLEKTRLESDHRSAIVQERENAANEAKAQLRLEIATQTKLFSVAIFPYVKIETDKGLIWDDHKAVAGYQYQLLVNGIPAFEPHVVKIHETVIKEVNEAAKKTLLNVAEKAVNAAIATYLPGANADLFKRGEPVIKEGKK
ncbi:hypothetical protein AWB77_06827 [Caballeronia fortuita]|uniref:Uncharacterized protein n=1 Tax=Caballeronia fortuita TaxID=1777138 RepID=A0A158E9R9_9BURK|nr:hypothetical protein [Caballeronia fortuita]SAL03598.1 hypothetical protein AWB77_06827 [Caballeronia fortuita]